MRVLRLVAVLVATALGLLVLPSAAQAQSSGYPPGQCTTLSVSATVTTPNGHLVVSGTLYTPGDTVKILLESNPVVLTEVTVKADGTFSVEVTIPADITLGHHLILTSGGGPSCPVDPITITVKSSGAAGASSGPGGTAFTGVAILGLVVIAAGLLVVGSMVNRGGRRRRHHRHVAQHHA